MKELKTIQVWTAETKSWEQKTGDYAIRAFHQLHLDVETISSYLFWVNEIFEFGEDPEADYYRGMGCDWEGNLVWIDADGFMKAVGEYINDKVDEGAYEKEEKKSHVNDLKKFTTYTGYHIICETKNG